MSLSREIIKLKKYVTGCCPGHDTFPNGSYRNRRSKKRRAKDKTLEHKYVRLLIKRQIKKDLDYESSSVSL